MTTTNDHSSIHLPAWLAYLSLGFKFISTVIIVLMPVVYEQVIRYVVGPNVGFVSLLFTHLSVGYICFKQVREPLLRLLKRITSSCNCKSAAIAPQPQSNKVTWLNPN